MLTLGKAACEVGKTKTAIANAIKSGRLSATRDDKGQYQIDPAELFRVYPAKGQEVGDTRPNETATLQRENELLREQIDRERRQLESQIDDLKADRDHWRQQATMLLTHQPPVAGEMARPGFWRRLFGSP